MRNIEELIDNSLNIIKSAEGYKFDKLEQFKKILSYAKKNLSELDNDINDASISIINIDEAVDTLQKSGFVVISDEDFEHVVSASVELSDAIKNHKK